MGRTRRGEGAGSTQALTAHLMEEACQQPVELIRQAQVGRVERARHDLQGGAGNRAPAPAP